jgi:hypothetical protein
VLGEFGAATHVDDWPSLLQIKLILGCYMRVNIYAEELRPLIDKYGERVTRIAKQVVPTLPQEHQAIQILLGDRFIHTDNKAGTDDDTPGVKFWYYTELERELLAAIFEKALEELKRPEAKGA